MFHGLVLWIKKCKTVGYTRNGVVKMIIPEKDHLAIFIDIEYQKKRRNRDEQERNAPGE